MIYIVVPDEIDMRLAENAAKVHLDAVKEKAMHHLKPEESQRCEKWWKDISEAGDQ